MGHFLGHIPALLFTLVLLLISQSLFGGAGEAHWKVKVNCIKRERDALLQFRESLTDESNRLSSWIGEDCCAWEGVHCSNSTGHVLKLDLHNPVSLDFDRLLTNPTGYLAYFSSISLGGQLNPSLSTLKFLQYLDLSNNDFSGNEIPTFLELLKDLRYLNLSDSGFAGKIPNHLGNLSKLQYLDLSENSLTTENLWWVSRLTSLRVLFFSSLSIGDIQDWLRVVNMLPSLESLALYDCELTSFPDLSHVNLTSLTVLELGNNYFHSTIPLLQGSMPTDIGHLKKLNTLDLSFNSLSGTIPISLGMLTELQELSIHGNSLSGVLSELHFANLKELRVLSISGNYLLSLNISSSWNPPFQLHVIRMDSLKIGPQFPAWLQTQKEVQELVMSNASISDSIPKWFRSQCCNMRMLYLSDNNITGNPLQFKGINNQGQRYILLSSNQFQGSLKSFPTDISYLDLSKNLLTGRIPLPDGDTWMSTTILQLNDNLFTSSIPKELCKLKYLAGLDLSNNQLSGRIPWCLGNLRNLEQLALANNSLYGHIPHSLGNLDHLVLLQLNGNKFQGKLLPLLHNLTSLAIIDVGENGLNDTLPSWMGEKLTHLMFLRMDSNNFQGAIPLSLCQLSGLQVISLAKNNLTGSIPRCFNNFSVMALDSGVKNFKGYIAPLSLFINMKGGSLDPSLNLKYLRSIDLSQNTLIGEIPEEIMELVRLQNLDLSKNHLSGSIPKNIGNLKQLESLDLSVNQLFGAIPPSLSSLSFLGYLNLSYNRLSGMIPSGTQLQSFGPSSYEGNDGLCGKPLDNICQPTRVGPVLDDINGHNESVFLWFYAGAGPGFAVGLLGVLGTLHFKKSWRYAYFKFLENVYDRIWIMIALKSPS